MAKQVQLKAKPRSESGKGPVKRMRATGIVPAVVYGPKSQPLNIAVVAHDLEVLLQHATGENVLVDLRVEDGGKATNRLALTTRTRSFPVRNQARS